MPPVWRRLGRDEWAFGKYADAMNALRLTGKERDAEIGLDYFGAGYFSGAQGRFTSPDKPLLDQFENDPQSWNLYSYVRNNPLTFVDPNGEGCIYTNNFSQDGTVSVQRGNCSQKGGTFVDGTIDVKSITYNARSNELGYSYANDAAGTGAPGLQRGGSVAIRVAVLQRDVGTSRRLESVYWNIHVQFRRRRCNGWGDRIPLRGNIGLWINNPRSSVRTRSFPAADAWL
ncbi:MAG: RHS repeat-associated core domain-containing protein [Bryobacteraceae bacterium]